MISNEKGMAFPMVIMITAVLMALCMALCLFSMADRKHITLEEDKMQAHYLARAGAELVAERVYYDGSFKLELQSDPEPIPDKNGALESKNISFDGEELSHEKIKIEIYVNNDRVYIISEGIIPNIIFNAVTGEFRSDEEDKVTEKLVLIIDEDGTRTWRKWRESDG